MRAISGLNCAADVKTVSVMVNPLPYVAIIGLTGAYCQDAGVVPITGNPAGGRFTIVVR